MPLSKLFHKRNSLKAASKSSDLPVNKATSAPCDSVNEDMQSSTASTSSEQLALPTDPEIDVLSGKENKEVSAPDEQLVPPKIETVKDLICDPGSEEDRKEDSRLVERSSSKAENTLDTSIDCSNDEARKEDSMSTEQVPSPTEIVMEESIEAQNKSSTSTDQFSSKSENNQDVSFENKDCTLFKELSSETETVNSVPRDLRTEVSNVDSNTSDLVPEKGERICDASHDVKTVGIRRQGSASDELMRLKDENKENALCGFTNEDKQNKTCMSTEQLQKKGEFCPNFNESDAASGESIQCGMGSSCSFPQENADLQTKKGNVKSAKNSNRSSSFRESGTKPNPPKSRRRKCESESAASNSTDDEGFDDKVLRFGVTDLEKMIGQCVNKLIRESIATAVRSVNVDSLCDEVLRSISDRSQSESSSETVEQRLHTNSVKEYVDLETLDTFENEESDYEAEETLDDVEFQEELAQEMTLNQEKNSEGTECFLEDTENSNAVEELKVASGYHANCEESLSVHSTILDTGIDVKSGEIPSGNSISVGVISSEGNSRIVPGLSLLKQSESVNNSPKQDNAEVTKADVKHGIADSSLKEGDGEVKNSDVSSDIAGISLKKESEKGSKSDITNEIAGSSLEKDFKEGSKSDITNEIMDSVLKKAPEEMNRSNITNEIVESTLKQNSEEVSHKVGGMLRVESEDLISMSDDVVPEHLGESEQTQDEVEDPPDLGVNLPQQQSQATDEEKKVKWKAGYLHVKLPHKSRGKGHLKAWKKRCVSIQPDEFAHSDPCLIVSVFSGSERKRGAASFWKSVSCQRAVVYRSSSSTQRYAFTMAEEDSPVVHLAADSEADAQGWMAAMRAVLWPPSPVVELEKMLNGSQFEVSLIDNEFSYRAGLLGMYGHLTTTQKKLILVHPQQGYVIQEWYLNTVDKFELTHQTRIEDVHKVLCMTTCSDSSTGKGEILIFCREAVALLQSLASTIHQILTYHSKQEGGKYQKELEEIAEWLVPSTSSNAAEAEEYYKVPPRQVRSLLDIPNFIFDKPLTPVASVACSSGLSMDSATNKPLSEVSKTNPSRASQDSGISAGAQSADDFLNCSLTSFVVGGGAFHPGKSSDSELSDSYTPPVSPSVKVRHVEGLKAKGEA